jgi:hypothetical protein
MGMDVGSSRKLLRAFSSMYSSLPAHSIVQTIRGTCGIPRHALLHVVLQCSAHDPESSMHFPDRRRSRGESTCRGASSGKRAHATSVSAGTRPVLHGSCGRTHRPSNKAPPNTSATSPPRRTQPGRTTVRLCRRTDQAPSATSRARRPTSDGCGAGYHISCFKPPLTVVPGGDWLCPGCSRIPAADKRR